MKPTILVLGGSFAGLNAAFDLKRDLGDRANIAVISRQDQFVFIPSLIWVVPGWRRPDQITLDLKAALAPRHIDFIHAAAEEIDPEHNRVITNDGDFHYDYLLVATGPQFDWDAVPGLGPRGYTHSVCSLPHATDAAAAWSEFLKDPGPVVVGATQSASCFGAAYETVFNLDRALREAKVRDRAPVTFISSEPFIGHFGIGGVKGGQRALERLFEKQNIATVVDAAIQQVTPDEIHLQGGQTVPFKYAIVIPPFKGVEAIRRSAGLGDERGFIPTNARYQHPVYKNVYAAGVAVAAKAPEATRIPTGVPKTGYMSEVMAKVAAHNIAADITGGAPRELPFANVDAMCILDAGTQGAILATDRIFKPRQRELLVTGPWGHWAKLAFEKYYLLKMRGARIPLPKSWTDATCRSPLRRFARAECTDR